MSPSPALQRQCQEGWREAQEAAFDVRGLQVALPQGLPWPWPSTTCSRGTFCQEASRLRSAPDLVGLFGQGLEEEVEDKQGCVCLQGRSEIEQQVQRAGSQGTWV